MRRLCVGLVVVTLVGCTSGSGSEPTPPNASASVRMGQGEADGAIVFNTRSPSAVFTIDADGSNQRQIRSIEDAAIVSPDGTRFIDVALTADGRITPATFAADGSGYSVLDIPDKTLQLGDYRWSGDGTMIVAQGWDDTDPSRAGLYTFRSADGGGLARLTKSGDAHDYPIAFSPDGSSVLFTRETPPYDDSGPMDVFVVRTDGSDLLQLNPPETTSGLMNNPIVGSHSWSPDGRQVAFVASSGSFWDDPRAVFVVNADGSDARRITPWNLSLNAMWSPDGEWIAFTMSPDPGPHDLFVVHPDGTERSRITSAADGLFSFAPVWSPDGTGLLFVRSEGEMEQTDLWTVNVDGSGLSQVTNAPGEHFGYAWLQSVG